MSYSWDFVPLFRRGLDGNTGGRILSKPLISTNDIPNRGPGRSSPAGFFPAARARGLDAGGKGRL